MSETLKSWIERRLGIMIDLNPDTFGNQARDGILLARILHSYNIIDDSQLNTVIHTQDSLKNLHFLEPWLHIIQLDCDDQMINEISNGKGSVAIRLFCKIYLALENKHSLNIIEKFVSNSTKFQQTKVNEFFDKLATPLVDKSETIQWYQEKCQDIIKVCQLDRKKFKETQMPKNYNFESITSKIEKTRKIQQNQSVKMKLNEEIKQKEINDLEEFERKQLQLKDLEKKFSKDYKIQDMFITVKEYLKKTKKQRDQEETVKNFKNRMQKLLLSEIWEKMCQDHEDKLDEIIAEKIFTQSEYEKGIMTNLLKIHHQKIKIAENRQLADDLVAKIKEGEFLQEYQREQEIEEREKRELNDEWKKFCRLQTQIHKEHIKIVCHEICSKIVFDLVDKSLKTAECSKEEIISDNWKFFFKKNPVFQSLEDEKQTFEQNKEKQSFEKNEEKIRDFEVYHNIEFPWSEFLPSNDETQEILKLGKKVLGYIVHKLLNFLHPQPRDFEPISLPQVDKKIIIRGLLLDQKKLSSFNDTSEIKLISLKEAINFFIKIFKEEMKNNEYISLTPFASQEKLDKKEEKKKKRKSSKKITFLHKEVQTPKNIPHENASPILSENASIGKCIYDLLSTGQSIPVDLSTKTLIQYLKNFENIKGWAVFDYPNNYEEMKSLEEALTGFKFSSLEEDYRESISFQDSFKRNSKLLPNPIIKTQSKTFMTNFIRIEKSKDSKDLNEAMMDIYYTNQDVASIIHLHDNDDNLKKLSKFLNDKIDLHPEFSETEISQKEVSQEISNQKPGDDNWEWSNFSQPNNILEPISILWENLEASYIANLGDILFIKKNHSQAIEIFRDLILKRMENFISRSDVKQGIFEIFYEEFNSLDEITRHDFDVKCELQCRLADVQSELFDVCDRRKAESEEERQRMIDDDWMAMEAMTFINVYIAIIQVEMDRCTDTIQILQDYYDSMLQRPLGTRVSKVRFFPLKLIDSISQRSMKSVSMENGVELLREENENSEMESNSVENSEMESNKVENRGKKSVSGKNGVRKSISVENVEEIINNENIDESSNFESEIQSILMENSNINVENKKKKNVENEEMEKRSLSDEMKSINANNLIKKSIIEKDIEKKSINIENTEKKSVNVESKENSINSESGEKKLIDRENSMKVNMSMKNKSQTEEIEKESLNTEKSPVNLENKSVDLKNEEKKLVNLEEIEKKSVNLEETEKKSLNLEETEKKSLNLEDTENKSLNIESRDESINFETAQKEFNYFKNTKNDELNWNEFECTKKKNSKNDLSSGPPIAVDFKSIKHEITNLLQNKLNPCDDEMTDPCLCETIFYKTVKENIDYAKSVVDYLASSFNDTVEKLEKWENSKTSGNSVTGDNLKKLGNLLREWQYATMFEINRMKMRLEILNEAFLFDINYLLDNIQQAFQSFQINAVERYKREMNSVNEMTKEFYLAIEQGRSIKDEMFFDGDRFTIKNSFIEDAAPLAEEDEFSPNEMP